MRRKPRVSGELLERARAERERRESAAEIAAAGARIEALAYQLFVARGRDAAVGGDDWLAAERALILGHEPVSIDWPSP